MSKVKLNIGLLTHDSNLREQIHDIFKESDKFIVADLEIPDDKSEIMIIDLDTISDNKLSELNKKYLVFALTREKGSRYLIESMTFGAFDCHILPLDVDKFKEAINKAFEIKSEISSKTIDYTGNIQGTGVACAIVGDSPMLQEVCKLIGQMGQVDVPVLITGESGTGKDLVAESIWKVSTRWEKPFVTINCAAIPESLLEAELFGHEKGAFTGASTERIGKFEEAEGGIVFLDEIGDMPLPLQAKVLRVLQNSTFQKLGGNKDIKVDIRIIAATNKNLENLVKQGKFREDLYFRINVIKMNLPSLKERKEDIPLLSECFIRRYSSQMGKPINGVSEKFLESLKNYSWPGNIRELENTIRKAIALTKTNYLTSFDINLNESDIKIDSDPYETLKESVEAKVNKLLDSQDNENLYSQVIKEVETILLNQALKLTGDNQSKASRLLGINRLTLRKKLEEYV
ncbi:MAG: AAA domain-containing protein [Candidatus Dadabacteria bacterium]|nr:AAA domain-containing protein [Candidatus Dadabacteria bacterium]NIQ13474.1 AAA domain-containing protein [Candidatus Dadabacteria bacterium]